MLILHRQTSLSSRMKLVARLKEQAWRLKLELHALCLAYADPRTPWTARLLVICIVAYSLSPIDLIPDPIPIIGHLDDLILVPLGIALAIRLIPESVIADCRERARQAIFHQPLSWKRAGTAFVLFVWLLIAAIVWPFIHCWMERK
jgi:uncharacterized membrane protein YkvA (DUF1232 family)